MYLNFLSLLMRLCTEQKKTEEIKFILQEINFYKVMKAE